MWKTLGVVLVLGLVVVAGVKWFMFGLDREELAGKFGPVSVVIAKRDLAPAEIAAEMDAAAKRLGFTATDINVRREAARMDMFGIGGSPPTRQAVHDYVIELHVERSVLGPLARGAKITRRFTGPCNEDHAEGSGDAE